MGEFIEYERALARVAINWDFNSALKSGLKSKQQVAIVQTWAEVTNQTWHEAECELIAKVEELEGLGL